MRRGKSRSCRVMRRNFRVAGPFGWRNGLGVAILDSLLTILTKRAAPEAVAWLQEQVVSLRANFEERRFYYAFSGVSRRFDKSPLAVVEAVDDEAAAALGEVEVVGWDEFRLARVILLLVLAEQEEAVLRGNLEALLGSADLREQVAIFSAFAFFLPSGDGEQVIAAERTRWLVGLARDGLRTNIVDVYDAIALDNPFPARAFFDDAWNQMVLKALFISRPLYRIRGIDGRANLTLAEALSNLAHERWAAGRWVSPELWRSCAKFLTETIVADVARVAATDEPGQREAAALIISGDKQGLLDHARDRVSSLLDDVENGSLTWDSLGEQVGASLAK